MAGIVNKVYCSSRPRPHFVVCAHWSGRWKRSIKALSDNTRRKTSGSWVFLQRQSKSEGVALSRLDILDLLGNKRLWFVSCDWWIAIRLCVSVVFEKRSKFFLSSTFFIFLLKHGKFRLYSQDEIVAIDRASKFRRNTGMGG